MSLLAHTALLAQQAFGPLEGVGTALAGWAVDDPDRHRPKPPVVDGDTLRLFGDTRVYLVADHTQSEWSDHEYIHMLHDGREMSFTLDLSRVPCGCIATVYLVQMDRPGLTDANYCDANTSPSHWCTEIDITEGNVAGSAAHGAPPPARTERAPRECRRRRRRRGRRAPPAAPDGKRRAAGEGAARHADRRGHRPLDLH